MLRPAHRQIRITTPIRRTAHRSAPTPTITLIPAQAPAHRSTRTTT